MSRSVSSAVVRPLAPADRQTSSRSTPRPASKCGQDRSALFSLAQAGTGGTTASPSAFSRNCSAFVMERSHPERPLTKCLLILSGCLVKIAHFTNHLGRCGRNNAFGRRCWEHPGGSVLCCVICSRCWNPYPQQWLASRRIALRHWRTPDAALAGSYFYRSASRI